MRLRRLAGMALLLACVAAYWMHFENRFAELEAEISLRDATGLLSASERQRLLTMRTMLRDEFGVSARLVVRGSDESAEMPAVAGNVLYLAVTPGKGEARVLLPPLVQRVLDAKLGAAPDVLLAERLSECAMKSTSASVGPCLESVLVDVLAVLGMSPSAPGAASMAGAASMTGAASTTGSSNTPSSATVRGATNSATGAGASTRGPLNTTLPPPNPPDVSFERATP